METEYNKKQIELAAKIPPFKLGELVETPDGKGIIVALSMPYNGLYLSFKNAKAVVWYSTSEADLSNNKVNWEYDLTELQTLKPTSND
jgi:hypothetical protein